MIEINEINCIYCLFITTLFGHFFLLLNDGIYLDGWYVDGWHRHSQWPALKEFTSQVGMPYLYYYYRIVSFFPHKIFIYKLISFIGIYASSVFVFILLNRSGFFNTYDSFMVALFMSYYPGQQISVEGAVSQYFLFPSIFFFGSFLAYQAEIYTGFEGILLRGIAIILFFLSFNMNSVLSFYFSFILFILLIKVEGTKDIIHETLEFTLFHIDYILLPFLFWVLKEKITKRHGHYKNYNRIQWNLKNIFKGMINTIEIGFIGNISQAAAYVLQKPKRIVLAVFFAMFFLLIFWKNHPVGISNIKSTQIIAFGFILLTLASTPYILVGIRFGLRGWATRSNALLALPVAIILFGICNFLFKPECLTASMILLLIIFLFYLNYNYLSWISLWAKHRSMLQNLGGLSKASRFSVISVQDEYSTPACNGKTPEHWTISLTYMFAWLWGDVTRLGVNHMNERKYTSNRESLLEYSQNEIYQIIHDTTLDYALKDIDPKGRQTLLIIKKGNHDLNDIQIAIQYLKIKFFRPKRMPSFLSQLTKITLIPLKPPNTTKA